jgi:hypothetical protein
MSNKNESNDATKALIEVLLSGGIMKMPDVALEPEVTLIRWSVLRTDEGDHLVGFNLGLQLGRVSTPIRRFDPGRRQCVTSSGRRYRLEGVPGQDPDAFYVCSQIDRADETIDVTPQYWQAIVDAAGEAS